MNKRGNTAIIIVGIILLLVIIGFALFKLFIKPENLVCCKITIVYPGAEPTYTWQEESYCSSIMDGRPIMGASRIIVSDSFCNDLGVGDNLLSIPKKPISQSISGFGGGKG